MGLRVILARSLSEGSIPFISTINEAIRRLTKEFPAEIFAPSSMPVGRLTLNQETVVRVHEGQPNKYALVV